MKKILLGVALIATALIATSCNKERSNEPDPSKYKLEISNITYNAADILIDPADTTITYIWSVYEKEVFDKYGDAAGDSIKASLLAALDYYNAELKAMYEEYGLEWKDEYAYTIADFLANGKQEQHVTGLKESHKYYLVLAEMDEKGEFKSEVYFKPFETPAFKVTSDLKIAVSNEGNVIKFTPDNNNEKYYWNWTTQFAMTYYGFEDITEMAEDDIAYYGEEIEDFLVNGEDGEDVSEYEAEGYVASGDTVYAYAFGYKDGGRTTNVFSKTFIYGAKSSAPARRHFMPAKRRNVKDIRRNVRSIVVK